MSSKQIDKRARSIKAVVSTKLRKVRGTLKDYRLLVQCDARQDWQPMQATKLYVVHSVEYCVALEANLIVR